MQNTWKHAISALLATALLGSAVLLSVSQAKGPLRHAGENSFDSHSTGHTDKALIANWQDAMEQRQDVADANDPFDWGFGIAESGSNCSLRDPHVKPVVMDLPELLSRNDAAAIDTIKHKLGINVFRGSIFEGADEPATQLMKQSAAAEWLCGAHVPAQLSAELKKDPPPELRTFDVVLEKLEEADCGPLPGPVAENSKQAQACNANATVSLSAVADQAADSATCSARRASVTDCAYSCATSTPSRVSLELTPVTAADETPVATLRRTGMALDEAAQRLEESERYSEADALREAAQLLRLKAREFKNGQSTAHQVKTPTRSIRALEGVSDDTYGDDRHQ
jgi:hypothetical protein